MWCPVMRNTPTARRGAHAFLSTVLAVALALWAFAPASALAAENASPEGAVVTEGVSGTGGEGVLPGGDGEAPVPGPDGATPSTPDAPSPDGEALSGGEVDTPGAEAVDPAAGDADAPDAEDAEATDPSEDEDIALRALTGPVATDLPQVATLASAADRTRVVDARDISTLTLSASTSAASQRFFLRPVGGGWYALIDVQTEQALDVASASTADGTRVGLYADNGTDAQRWRFVAAGDGSYRVASKLRSDLVLDARDAAALVVRSADNSRFQRFFVEAPERTIDDGTYVLSSRAGTTVLDVAAASTYNGANVQMYTRNNTAAQEFVFVYDETTGYYTVETFASGKVLDVAGASAANGANVQQYDANGSAAQKWAVERAPGGLGYTVIAACSGLVLDVAGASRLDGANVQTYESNGSAAQIWTFDAPANVMPDEGLYVIESALNGRFALDIAAASHADGANVQLYRTNFTWAQKFNVEVRGDGFCVIRSLASGKVLDVAAAGQAPGTNVQQYTYNGSDAQLWKPVRFGDAYAFRSKANGLFLDVTGGSASNGANVQVWTGNGSAAQRFTLLETDTSTAVDEGAYVLRSASDGTVVDIQGAAGYNGARAQLYAANGSYAQKFKVLADGWGGYYFVNVHSSRYLDIDTGTGAVLQQWDRTEGDNQTWRFYPANDGSDTYYVESAWTGEYLTNAGGTLALAPLRNTAAQRFSLEHTKAFKVYLDAGHGYNSNGDGRVDAGACSQGYRECDLTEELVDKVAKELDRRGIEYIVGYGEAYWDRHPDAVAKGCSTFLSIHFNAAGGTGTETYIHSYNAAAGSPAFQKIMHSYLVTGTGLPDRGMKQSALAVCGGRLPSVLCEIAFIDRKEDMETYFKRQDDVARFLAAGIVEASSNSMCGWY